MYNHVSRLAVVSVSLACAACSSLWQLGGGEAVRDGVSSSLVDYLYPKGEVPPDQTGNTPQLSLPLRVGIAFVPGGYNADSAISETTKSQLLNRVKAEFVDRDYISHIEVIPDTYLRSSQGFGGMQQVARLYGVDVMALVSYDQVATSDDTKASILYWTIVGAYLIPATENQVSTFVDTAVFDVSSKTLLFRAPGTDKRQASSTAVESNQAIREGREAGFGDAMTDMTSNLVTELDSFETRLKDNPRLAAVSWKEGSGGGGDFGWLLLFALSLLLLGAARRGYVVAKMSRRRPKDKAQHRFLRRL